MTNTASPEELELGKKQALLERLKDRLADREENLADLAAEVEQFEARYSMEVGRHQAELDRIEVEIAEEEAKLVPDDEDIKRKLEELRRRAEASAAGVEEHLNAADWKPTAEAKKAYHNLAKIIHPDLALDEAEKERRHALMAQLNAAYSSGDQKTLNKLMDDFRDAPELVSGDTVADNLVRVIRQIYQVKNRMKTIEVEMSTIRSSERFSLFLKVEEEKKQGRDFLGQMGARSKTHVAMSLRRLNTLRNLNVAQADYVRDTFGVDIEEFRKKG